MSAHHTIALTAPSAYEARTYNILGQSAYVYRTSKGSYPTRVVFWDNIGRVQADGTFLDPGNRPTTERRSLFLSPESVTIDAYGTGTGTAGSGQVYGDGVIRPGDTVTVLAADGENLGRFTAVFTNNGHGYLAPAE